MPENLRLKADNVMALSVLRACLPQLDAHSELTSKSPPQTSAMAQHSACMLAGRARPLCCRCSCGLMLCAVATGPAAVEGPRVRMGLFEGQPVSVMPHPASGRADYFGTLCNR